MLSKLRKWYVPGMKKNLVEPKDKNEKNSSFSQPREN